MKMNKNIKNKINFGLFILMLGMAMSWTMTSNIYNLLITCQTPFDLFIIPGIFYYWMYKEKWSKENLDVHKIVYDLRG